MEQDNSFETFETFETFTVYSDEIDYLNCLIPDDIFNSSNEPYEFVDNNQNLNQNQNTCNQNELQKLDK